VAALQDLDIARWRLRNQHLVSPYADSAREAVGSLLAVQAENPSQAAWAVASRTPAPYCARMCFGPHGTSCGPRTQAGCST
jgi:hypothetical protein